MPRPESQLPRSATDGQVDLRVGLDRDPDDDQSADPHARAACSRTC